VPTSAAARVTAPAASATDIEIVAAVSDREGLVIFNDSVQTLYIRFGSSAASLSDWSVKLLPGDLYEIGNNITYYGAVHGIWAAADASGKARVTEFA